jgi:hypothetical protein
LTVRSAFATTALIPSIRRIQEDFESNDANLSAFIVYAYVLGFTAGPLLIVPLAELFGQIPLYHCCNLLFNASTCWCAVNKGLGMMALARVLSGCGGAVTESLAAGSIGDIVQGGMSHLPLTVAGMALHLTPAISPLIGSHIYFKWDWAWIFWITATMGGVCTTIGFLLPESYEPVLLRMKANERRRRIHNLTLFTPFDENPDQIITDHCWTAMHQPLRILVSPSFFVCSFIPAIGFAFLYIVYINLPQAFRPVYSLPEKDLGFAYLGTAVGIMIASASGAAASERYMKLRARNSDTRTEIRLIPFLCFWPMAGLGLCPYGYFVRQKMHWAGPIVSSGLVGTGVTFAIVGNNLRSASLV